ncbi:hypothetical protein AOE01nite_17700 [Acetobacter oeni]|uniref:Transposase DDE domain-containing protein n=1 Tax=Acetobacter oeni TaxID=304077 RepID=A0A511XKT6_9PROT|nr:transposase [Acetobacter oeni]GBR10419.1 transposase [Acetobacter oeni LMG 21952]GEN63546.1 hypothetical protein AOE01nite_17700 [Acetobacter oeni]
MFCWQIFLPRQQKSSATGAATVTGIPPKKNMKSKLPHNWHLYKKRHQIKNMFAKLKDWRRVATRYDRCAHTFMSVIHIAATFIFYSSRKES